MVPPPPNEVQNYQLPDVHYQTNPEAMTRNFQQDLYYEEQVLVKNHVVWQPTLYRTYEYVPPRLVSQGPMRSGTDGTGQPNPVPQFNNNTGGGVQLPYHGPQAAANPQDLLGTLFSTLTTLLSTLQQWAGGY
jgi:hypothetical protein